MVRKMLRTNTAVTFLLFLLPAFASSQPFEYGVAPATSVARIEDHLSIFAQMLGERIDRPVVVKSRKDFQTFREALRREVFDMALVQPFDYIKLRQSGSSYQPVARLAAPFKAIVVVTDKNIHTLSDLKGLKVAFPPEDAAVTILALHRLRELGYTTKDFQVTYYSEHNSCIQALLIGTAKACVTVNELMHLLTKGDALNLRVIEESAAIPNALLVLKGSAAQYRERLIEFVMEYNDTPEGQEFYRLFAIKGYVPAQAADYDIVETILNDYNSSHESTTENEW